MTKPWNRARYFGVPADCGTPEIAAPGWNAGDSPYSWISSDTRYRWYFGIDGTYRLIGYGAAQDSLGRWHYVGSPAG